MTSRTTDKRKKKSDKGKGGKSQNYPAGEEHDWDELEEEVYATTQAAASNTPAGWYKSIVSKDSGINSRF